MVAPGARIWALQLSNHSATLERENKEWMAEPGIGELMRRIDAIALEDPGHSELWEEATPVPD